MTSKITPKNMRVRSYKARDQCREWPFSIYYFMLWIVAWSIGKILLTSPIVINMQTRASLVVETKDLLFLWLAYLNNKSNVCKQISSLYMSGQIWLVCINLILSSGWKHSKQLYFDQNMACSMRLVVFFYSSDFPMATARGSIFFFWAAAVPSGLPTGYHR